MLKMAMANVHALVSVEILLNENEVWGQDRTKSPLKMANLIRYRLILLLP